MAPRFAVVGLIVGLAVLVWARRARAERRAALVWAVVGLLVAAAVLPVRLGNYLHESRIRYWAENALASTGPLGWLVRVGFALGVEVVFICLVWAAVLGIIAWRARPTERHAPKAWLLGGLAILALGIGIAPDAVHAGRRGRVLSECREQTLRHPDDSGVHLGYAQILAYLGYVDTALGEAQRATALSGGHEPDYRLWEGLLLLKLHRPTEAVVALGAAYRDRAWYSRCAADEAAHSYVTNPASSASARKADEAQLRHRIFEEGERQITKASYNYAMCVVLLGQWDEAAEVGRQLAHEVPDDSSNWALAFMLSQATGREAEARDFLAQGQKAIPSSATDLQALVRDYPTSAAAQAALVVSAHRLPHEF
jgi:tetratricopeptide (TPR) repeat protein